MKLMNTFIAIDDFEPLYKRGDKFVIVKKNIDENLMPWVAKRLKNGAIYGFDEGELRLEK